MELHLYTIEYRLSSGELSRANIRATNLGGAELQFNIERPDIKEYWFITD